MWLSFLIFLIFLFIFTYSSLWDYIRDSLKKKRYMKRRFRYIKYICRENDVHVEGALKIVIVKTKTETFIGLILIVWFWNLLKFFLLIYIHILFLRLWYIIFEQGGFIVVPMWEEDGRWITGMNLKIMLLLWFHGRANWTATWQVEMYLCVYMIMLYM